MALIRPSTFFRQVNPRGAIADFVEVWRQAGKNRWRIAVLSAATTIGVFSIMWQEIYVGPPRRPTINYITVWDPHRMGRGDGLSPCGYSARRRSSSAISKRRASLLASSPCLRKTRCSAYL